MPPMSPIEITPHKNSSMRSTPEYRTRSGEIDALKGLAILGVLITHMSFGSRFEPSTLQLINTLQLILGWCVLAFFFCSGLLAKPVTTKQEALKLLKKRCLRLVVPCLIFSLTYKVVLFGIYLTGVFGWDSPLPQTNSDILPFLLGPVGPQFYFLYYLFFISIAVAIAEWLLSQSFLAIALVLILPLSYATFFDTPTRGYGPEWPMIPLYSFTYLSGYFLAQTQSLVQTQSLAQANISSSDRFNLAALKNPGFKHWLLYSIAIGVPILAVMIMGKSLVVSYAVIPLLLWSGLAQYPALTATINKTNLGVYSSAIYVWHAPILLPFFSIAWFKVLGGSPIILLPILISTIAISYGLKYLTDQYTIFQPWRF